MAATRVTAAAVNPATAVTAAVDETTTEKVMVAVPTAGEMSITNMVAAAGITPTPPVEGTTTIQVAAEKTTTVETMAMGAEMNITAAPAAATLVDPSITTTAEADLSTTNTMTAATITAATTTTATATTIVEVDGMSMAVVGITATAAEEARVEEAIIVTIDTKNL